MSGDLEWNAPYGGLFINIAGPEKEHQLCIQASSVGTSALLNLVNKNDSTYSRIITITEPKSHKQQQKHTLCFPAYKNTVLFAEPEVGSFVSSKVKIEYDIEVNPRYGEEGK